MKNFSAFELIIQRFLSRTAVVLLVLSMTTLLRAQTGATPPQASPKPEANERTAALESLRKTGVAAMNNLDYTEAQAKFEEMIKLDPENPAGYYYAATNHWVSTMFAMRRLQINIYNTDSFYAGTNEKPEPQMEVKFRATCQKAIDLAQARLAKNANDEDALYFLGATYGSIAGFDATITRDFIPAMKNGGKGVDFHRKLIKANPNFVDANLTIGLYDYVLGTLPLPFKVLAAVTGNRGNRKRGIEELKTAADKGKYVSTEASVILVALTEHEQNYPEAIKLLDQLTSQFPANYLFVLERAMALSLAGQRQESYDTFDKLIADKRHLSIIDLIHYQYGESLLAGGEYERAREQYDAVTKLSGANSNLVSLAYLREGQALDAAGHHDAALTRYQIVLKRGNVFDSHDQAKSYSLKPFAPERMMGNGKKEEGS